VSTLLVKVTFLAGEVNKMMGGKTLKLDKKYGVSGKKKASVQSLCNT